jgi:hypothetical protein
VWPAPVHSLFPAAQNINSVYCAVCVAEAATYTFRTKKLLPKSFICLGKTFPQPSPSLRDTCMHRMRVTNRAWPMAHHNRINKLVITNSEHREHLWQQNGCRGCDKLLGCTGSEGEVRCVGYIWLVVGNTGDQEKEGKEQALFLLDYNIIFLTLWNNLNNTK